MERHGRGVGLTRGRGQVPEPGVGRIARGEQVAGVGREAQAPDRVFETVRREPVSQVAALRVPHANQRLLRWVGRGGDPRAVGREHHPRKGEVLGHFEPRALALEEGGVGGNPAALRSAR